MEKSSTFKLKGVQEDLPTCLPRETGRQTGPAGGQGRKRCFLFSFLKGGKRSFYFHFYIEGSKHFFMLKVAHLFFIFSSLYINGRKHFLCFHFVLSKVANVEKTDGKIREHFHHQQHQQQNLPHALY